MSWNQFALCTHLGVFQTATMPFGKQIVKIYTFFLIYTSHTVCQNEFTSIVVVRIKYREHFTSEYETFKNARVYFNVRDL